MPEMTLKRPHSAQIYLSQLQMNFNDKNKIFSCFFALGKNWIYTELLFLFVKLVILRLFHVKSRLGKQHTFLHN